MSVFYGLFLGIIFEGIRERFTCEYSLDFFGLFGYLSKLLVNVLNMAIVKKSFPLTSLTTGPRIIRKITSPLLGPFGASRRDGSSKSAEGFPLSKGKA